MSEVERIEKFRDLVKRCERALGEENVVSLEMLNSLGIELKENEEYEEAKEVYERCLLGQMKVLEEDHKDTLETLNNLGEVYSEGLKNYEKALEYYERALKGCERVSGKNHPLTITIVSNIAEVYQGGDEFGKAEELFERALEGLEAQFGKDHRHTKHCAKNFSVCLKTSGNSKRLAELKDAYRWLDEASGEGDNEEGESDDQFLFGRACTGRMNIEDSGRVVTHTGAYGEHRLAVTEPAMLEGIHEISFQHVEDGEVSFGVTSASVDVDTFDGLDEDHNIIFPSLCSQNCTSSLIYDMRAGDVLKMRLELSTSDRRLMYFINGGFAGTFSPEDINDLVVPDGPLVRGVGMCVNGDKVKIV